MSDLDLKIPRGTGRKLSVAERDLSSLVLDLDPDVLRQVGRALERGHRVVITEE